MKTKKRNRKYMSLALALVMTFCFACPAFAADVQEPAMEEDATPRLTILGEVTRDGAELCTSPELIPGTGGNIWGLLPLGTQLMLTGKSEKDADGNLWDGVSMVLTPGDNQGRSGWVQRNDIYLWTLP